MSTDICRKKAGDIYRESNVVPRKGETVDDDILQSVVLRLLKDTRQNRARAALAKAALAKAEGA